MKFNKVNITNVRNIEEISFLPSQKFNLITGANGSGKTSILESLYYFGHARSFRSHIANRMIKHGQDTMTLFAELISAENLSITVGIQRNDLADCKIAIQKQPAKNTAELASLLPILLINPDSFSLFHGGSKPRRALLDWGMFHVEQSYYLTWSRFQRCLKQRNMALKQHLSPDEMVIWDKEFCLLATEIDVCRKRYYEELCPKFKAVIEKILPEHSIQFNYHRGWASDNNLEDLLNEHYIQDIERGYSFYGPQRGDLALKVEDVPILDFMSRGQQKAVVCALYIAQAELLAEQTNKKCVFLVDDLAAELGAEYRAYLIETLNRLDAQVYLTAIDKEALLSMLEDKEFKMFHVEQGKMLATFG